MEVNKLTLELTQEDVRTLMDIFEFYIISNSSLTGNDLRVVPINGSLSHEYKFIKSYIHKVLPYKSDEILKMMYLKRKEHIEWLFEDECGECHIKLPQSLDEMKQFLYLYDMDFLGNIRE